MTLSDYRRPLFACRMIYRSSPAVVVLERPPPTFLTAVPVVWNAFQAREMTLLLIPNSAATLVTVCPSYSFPIILPRVKSSRSIPPQSCCEDWTGRDLLIRGQLGSVPKKHDATTLR
ncbi:structural maintenance of chromosomes protein 2-2 [Trichonephila clavipes]|nr:structural maintenance of chromosomes protein 2-2 [Trichonephila clavipes]